MTIQQLQSEIPALKKQVAELNREVLAQRTEIEGLKPRTDSPDGQTEKRLAALEATSRSDHDRLFRLEGLLTAIEESLTSAPSKPQPAAGTPSPAAGPRAR